MSSRCHTYVIGWDRDRHPDSPTDRAVTPQLLCSSPFPHSPQEGGAQHTRLRILLWLPVSSVGKADAPQALAGWGLLPTPPVPLSSKTPGGRGPRSQRPSSLCRSSSQSVHAASSFEPVLRGPLLSEEPCLIQHCNPPSPPLPAHSACLSCLHFCCFAQPSTFPGTR